MYCRYTKIWIPVIILFIDFKLKLLQVVYKNTNYIIELNLLLYLLILNYHDYYSKGNYELNYSLGTIVWTIQYTYFIPMYYSKEIKHRMLRIE